MLVGERGCEAEVSMDVEAHREEEEEARGDKERPPKVLEESEKDNGDECLGKYFGILFLN